MKLARKTLYESVWEFPRKTLAARWNVNTNTINTACKASEIPLPPPGYWTKREMGKPTERPKLAGSADDLIELVDPPKRKPKRVKRPEQLPTSKPEVEEPISTAHPTLPPTQVRREPRACKSIDESLPIIRKAYRSYSSPKAPRDLRYKHVLPTSDNIIRMTVMPELVERALLILDAFLRECHRKKWPIQIPATKDRSKNSVEVEGVSILFSIIEQRRQEKIKSERSWSGSDYIYHSTGILRFQYSSSTSIWHEIKDRKQARLEDRITDIMQAIENEVDQVKRSEQARKERERLSRLRDKLSRLVEKALTHNHECDQRLERYLDQRRKAQNIRELAEAFRLKAPMENRPPEHEDWLDWLDSKADEVDPTTNINTLDFTVPVDITSQVKAMINQAPEQYEALQELDLDASIENILRWLSSTHTSRPW